MSLNFERKIVSTTLFLFTLIMIGLAFFANGTGDEGDSILHYLFSRFAFDHPENFLNHWAKPVFVLLTAPVAQGGFIAMKLFNIAILISTLWITWRTAKLLQIPNAWLVIFPVMFSPMSVSHTLSGLTEPLFAFWLILGIYFFVKKQPTVAVLWLSFLPFVRSEGLIIFCVVLIYLLLKKHWKLVPLLATGHVVYSIIGFFHYRDFLWVFNKMTYATIDGAYGSGPLYHFAKNMHHVMGDLLPLLLLFGVLVGGIRIMQLLFKQYSFSKEELWLIYGIGIAYFIAHSLFWYLGIFNSFGLMRVMIGVLPLYAIIIVQGINFLISFIAKKQHKQYTLYSAATLIGIFFFLKISFQKHLMLNDAQLCQTNLAEKHAKKYKDYTFYYDAIHPSLAFDVDWFHATEHRMTGQLFSGEPIPAKSVAVWDSWFSKSEANIPLKKMQKDHRLKEIECIEINGRKSCLFEFDSTFANAHIVMNTSFEDEEDFKFIDTTIVKTGKNSWIVGPKRPFSKSFTGWINSFRQVEQPKIKVSFWAFCPTGTKPQSHNAQTVISFESALKSFDYHSEKVFKNGDKAGAWKYVETVRPIPPYKTFRDKIKIYVWNPGKVNVLIDDFKIEWFSDESN